MEKVFLLPCNFVGRSVLGNGTIDSFSSQSMERGFGSPIPPRFIKRKTFDFCNFIMEHDAIYHYLRRKQEMDCVGMPLPNSMVDDVHKQETNSANIVNVLKHSHLDTWLVDMLHLLSQRISFIGTTACPVVLYSCKRRMLKQFLRRD